MCSSNWKFFKSGLLANGYDDTMLIAFRLATALEIKNFYMSSRFNYSDEKASQETESAMAPEEHGGQLYGFDGHLRKLAHLDLMKGGIFNEGICLNSWLLPHLSAAQEIAFSISRNTNNEYFCLLQRSGAAVEIL